MLKRFNTYMKNPPSQAFLLGALSAMAFATIMVFFAASHFLYVHQTAQTLNMHEAYIRTKAMQEESARTILSFDSNLQTVINAIAAKQTGLK